MLGLSRMFKLGTGERVKTCNPFHGCLFNCYGGKCWASQQAKRLQAMGVKGYEEGFKPHFSPHLLHKKFGKEVVFVCSMGDIACATEEQRTMIVYDLVCPNSNTTFFFETKAPEVYYLDWVKLLPRQTILSTTIETDHYSNPVMSYAPSPMFRYLDMVEIDWPNKHVSVEPIIKFDHDTLSRWIVEIDPKLVSIGYDNYHLHLPEPRLAETEKLIEWLEAVGIQVERKTLRKAWDEK